MSAFQVVSFHNILFLELIHILGHKVTIFFEYIQVYIKISNKKYFSTCLYAKNVLPLQSQIQAIGFADIL